MKKFPDYPSRQHRWQLKKMAEGKCPTCGNPKHPDSKLYCAEHVLKARKRQRVRLGRETRWEKPDTVIGRVGEVWRKERKRNGDV